MPCSPVNQLITMPQWYVYCIRSSEVNIDQVFSLCNTLIEQDLYKVQDNRSEFGVIISDTAPLKFFTPFVNEKRAEQYVIYLCSVISINQDFKNSKYYTYLTNNLSAKASVRYQLLLLHSLHAGALSCMVSYLFGLTQCMLITYLLLGRNIEPSMNTEPDNRMYQHVLNSLWLKIQIYQIQGRQPKFPEHAPYHKSQLPCQ